MGLTFEHKFFLTLDDSCDFLELMFYCMWQEKSWRKIPPGLKVLQNSGNLKRNFHWHIAIVYYKLLFWLCRMLIKMWLIVYDQSKEIIFQKELQTIILRYDLLWSLMFCDYWAYIEFDDYHWVRSWGSTGKWPFVDVVLWGRGERIQLDIESVCR